MEAMRCLKRRLSDIVYRTMLDDSTPRSPGDHNGPAAGPGGHRGNGSDSSATGSQPHTSSSGKSLPGPATTDPRIPFPPLLDTQGSHERAQGKRPRGSAGACNSRRARDATRAPVTPEPSYSNLLSSSSTCRSDYRS